MTQASCLEAVHSRHRAFPRPGALQGAAHAEPARRVRGVPGADLSEDRPLGAPGPVVADKDPEDPARRVRITPVELIRKGSVVAPMRKVFTYPSGPWLTGPARGLASFGDSPLSLTDGTTTRFLFPWQSHPCPGSAPGPLCLAGWIGRSGPGNAPAGGAPAPGPCQGLSKSSTSGLPQLA